MKKNGFTLIELLITTSLAVLLLLGVSSLFMTFLVSSAKTNTKKTIKEEGFSAMGQMEFLIRNAQYIDETLTPCMVGMTSLAVVSLDGGTTTFSKMADGDDESNVKIASNSSFLTSGNVTISSDPTFDCTGAVGNRQIEISFGLDKVTPDGAVTETFSSIVNLRN